MIPKDVRRVITGQRHNGESVFTHVEEIEPLRRQDGTPQWWGIWGFDELPALPYLNDRPYVAASLFPPAGAVRIQMVNIPPGTRDTIAVLPTSGLTSGLRRTSGTTPMRARGCTRPTRSTSGSWYLASARSSRVMATGFASGSETCTSRTEQSTPGTTTRVSRSSSCSSFWAWSDVRVSPSALPHKDGVTSTRPDFHRHGPASPQRPPGQSVKRRFIWGKSSSNSSNRDVT
jgi:hypothetical protein